MNKIAIAGTHSIGKTTLAEKISEKFNIPYIRGDKAKEICNTNFPNIPINKLNVDDAWKLQKLMFKSFNEALDYPGDCVTDGFHLTCLPYGLKYTDGKITHMEGYSQFVQDVLDKSKQFDAVFYLPPEIALENDNFRPQDQALRMDIDKSIFSLLQDFNYRVLSGTVEARIRQVSDELGLKNDAWSNYIVFEGLPRSGKTTQINTLKQNAQSYGKKLYICKRNDNEFMTEFKRRRKTNWYDNSREMLKLHAEGIKYDFRINNVEERLSEGQMVISDRQKFTTMSLFGALGVPRHILYEAVYDLPDPGKVIYLDTNPVISVMRSIETEPNKPLKVDQDFQEKVRDIYLGYAKDHRFKKIDSNLSPDKVTQDINQIIFNDYDFKMKQ
ncbi:MAG: AAA family ATPase [Nanoarchaeota archaeon]|nr:AAA family ATPase [Nanoarchaeota archaeon]